MGGVNVVMFGLYTDCNSEQLYYGGVNVVMFGLYTDCNSEQLHSRIQFLLITQISNSGWMIFIMYKHLFEDKLMNW